MGKIPLEKEMATHSSILAWRIRRTEEPGRLQYMELQKSQSQLGEQITNILVRDKIQCKLIENLGVD